MYAQQRPYLHRVLSYEEELIALVSFVLDRQSLWHSDATFAESLYGLKRVGQDTNTHLHARQRWNALLYVVCMCCMGWRCLFYTYGVSVLMKRYTRSYMTISNHHPIIHPPHPIGCSALSPCKARVALPLTP